MKRKLNYKGLFLYSHVDSRLIRHRRGSTGGEVKLLIPLSLFALFLDAILRTFSDYFKFPGFSYPGEPGKDKQLFSKEISPRVPGGVQTPPAFPVSDLKGGSR